MTDKYKSADIIYKSVEILEKQAKKDLKKGILSGYAVITHIKNKNGSLEPYYDLHGDHITDECIENLVEKTQVVGLPVYKGHVGNTIGKILAAYPMTKAKAEADGEECSRYGLKVILQITDPTSKEELQERVWKGMSVGFRFGDYRVDEEKSNDEETFYIIDSIAQLYEISVTNNPAQVPALITHVKSLDEEVLEEKSEEVTESVQVEAVEEEREELIESKQEEIVEGIKEEKNIATPPEESIIQILENSEERVEPRTEEDVKSNIGDNIMTFNKDPEGQVDLQKTADGQEAKPAEPEVKKSATRQKAITEPQDVFLARLEKAEDSISSLKAMTAMKEEENAKLKAKIEEQDALLAKAVSEKEAFEKRESYKALADTSLKNMIPDPELRTEVVMCMFTEYKCSNPKAALDYLVDVDKVFSNLTKSLGTSVEEELDPNKAAKTRDEQIKELAASKKIPIWQAAYEFDKQNGKGV